MFGTSRAHTDPATRAVPPIDLQVPATLETATFASG
jgi:hypothetical protein